MSGANSGTGATNIIFDYAQQHALLGTGKGTTPDGDYTQGTVVRMRPYVFNKDYQNGELSIDLPYRSMKSLDDESFYVYRSFIKL